LKSERRLEFIPVLGGAAVYPPPAARWDAVPAERFAIPARWE